MSNKIHSSTSSAFPNSTALDTLCWVRERLDAGDNDEIVRSMLRRERGLSAQIGAAMRNVIDHQTFKVGRTNYHSHLFSIPLVLEASGPLDPEAFELELALPLLVKALRDNGLTGRNAMLLNRLVPHSRLTAMTPSDLYALGREMFFTSVAAGAGQGRGQMARLRALRAEREEEDADQVGGASFHVVHLLGCIYSTRGQDTRLDGLHVNRLATILRTIIEFSATTSVDCPVRVRVGQPQSLCGALSSAILDYAEEVGGALFEALAGAEPAAAVEIDIDECEGGLLEHSVTVKVAHGEATLGLLRIDLSMHEGLVLDPLSTSLRHQAERHGLECLAPRYSANKARH